MQATKGDRQTFSRAHPTTSTLGCRFHLVPVFLRVVSLGADVESRTFAVGIEKLTLKIQVSGADIFVEGSCGKDNLAYLVKILYHKSPTFVI